MTVSISNIACGAYNVLLQKLKWVRSRCRNEERAGDFWDRARQKVFTKGWVQSKAHWFDTSASIAVPLELSFKASRYSECRAAVESFQPTPNRPNQLLVVSGVYGAVPDGAM
jgi:hypothetical protein